LLGVLLILIIEIMNYYLYDIAKGTTKENELFDYANIPDYWKTRSKNKNREKDDFEL